MYQLFLCGFHGNVDNTTSERTLLTVKSKLAFGLHVINVMNTCPCVIAINAEF